MSLQCESQHIVHCAHCAHCTHCALSIIHFTQILNQWIPISNQLCTAGEWKTLTIDTQRKRARIFTPQGYFAFFAFQKVNICQKDILTIFERVARWMRMCFSPKKITLPRNTDLFWWKNQTSDFTSSYLWGMRNISFTKPVFKYQSQPLTWLHGKCTLPSNASMIDTD